MNSTKDIKVTFLESAKYTSTEKIRVFFKDLFNNDIQIDLRPGEVVYSQTNHISNSLRIYSKKGIINIQEESKPGFLDYYVGYKQEEVDNKYFLFNLQNSLKKPLEKQKKETTKPTVEVKIKEDDLTVVEPNVTETVVDKAIKEVKKYSEKKKKTTKSKSRRSPGRPKKRGPKKGSKRKKTEE